MGKRNYSKVKRGMVFWFNPSKVYGEPSEYIGANGKSYKSHVQNGNRPWLVISNDEGNDSSPTCNIVPITLEEKTPIPTHVYFMFEGKSQTILCEQPKTVDIPALGEYACTLSKDVMERVDKALTIQNGIKPSVTYMDFRLDNVLNHLEEVITHIIQEKSKAFEESKKIVPIADIEDTALKLGTMLEELVMPSICSEEQQTPQPISAEEPIIKEDTPSLTSKKSDNTRMSQVEKFNAKYNKVVTKPEATTKSKRNSWTPESRRTYLDDCEKLSPQEIMKKYGFSAIQSVFQTKYQCKNFFEKSTK